MSARLLSLLALVLSCAPLVRAQTITLSAPLERIVVQRGPLNNAAVRIAGSLSSPADALESRALLQPGAVGGSSVDWIPVAAATPAGTPFIASLALPAGGWYRVEVRARSGAAYGPVAAIERVGVGEVFFLAGQSNMEGFYGSSAPSAATSDFVVRPTYTNQFPADFLATPQPSFRRLTDGMGNGQNGPWIAPRSGAGRAGMSGAFADEIVASRHVPVALFQCAVGGTSVLVWKNAALTGSTGTADTYLAMRRAFDYYLPHLGGIRAVLWHQGESDTGLNPSSRYTDALLALAAQSRIDSGLSDLPWLIARVSNPPGTAGTRQAVQGAQTEAIRRDPRLYAGPLTDDLPRVADGIHISAAGQATHGRRWADRVEAAFFSTPIVTVRALAATAIESPSQPAQFRILRTGSAGAALLVRYALSGSASPHADYPTSSSVLVPVGQDHVDLAIPALADAVSDSGETLVLTVLTDPAYKLKSLDPVAPSLDGTALPSESVGNVASVILLDSPSVNLPPTVMLTTPAADTAGKPGAPLFLAATASDPENAIAHVAFWRGTTLIAQTSTAPYIADWTPAAEGVYRVRAVVTDSGGLSSSSTELIYTVSGSAPSWVALEQDGLAVIEAESFQAQQSAGSIAWVPVVSPVGWGGDGLVQALPNASVNRVDSLAGPRLSYPVHFTRTGSYRIFIRGQAASTGDNSLHVGLDGVALTTGTVAGLSGFTSAYSWRSHGGDGSTILLRVSTPGVHNLDLWMREDGLVLDRIVLTLDPSVIQEGTSSVGPSVSPRVEAEGLGAPRITLQPTSQTVPVAGTALFTAVAAGAPPLTYQWLREGEPLPAANAAMLGFPATPAAAGVYQLRVENPLGFAISPPVELVAWRDFSTWSADQAIPAAPLSDPDADGLPNLLEYALGQDPLDAAKASPPPSLDPSVAQPVFRFTHPTGVVGVNYTVEYSTDLATWREASAPVSELRTSGTESLACTLPAGQARLFARLRVDLPP